MPNGYQASWNGGTCCGQAASAGLDDVALVRAIFAAEVVKHVNVDLGRVYATGLSNGGYLSYRLGCEASDLFTAVASGSGAVGTAAISRERHEQRHDEHVRSRPVRAHAQDRGPRHSRDGGPARPVCARRSRRRSWRCRTATAAPPPRSPRCRRRAAAIRRASRFKAAPPAPTSRSRGARFKTAATVGSAARTAALGAGRPGDRHRGK